MLMNIVDPEYGMFTWPCAPVLGQFVLHYREKCIGKNVLEIGAGTALPGIIAAKLGANVILTDAGRFRQCQENSMKSCRLNNVVDKVRIIPLTWGDFTPSLLDLPKIDIILGSDCFYSPSDFEDILVTIAYIMERNPSCVFWSTYQVRSCSWSIEDLLDKWGLTCTHIPLCMFGGNKENIGGHDMSNKHTIQMLEIKKSS